MTMPRRWTKSPHSGEETDCVEVALGTRRTLVRDTKNRGGGTLHLPAPAWAAFLTAVKADRAPGS
ncbi:DUF397 domain-containing protein [Amycolatopsis anabasis]|uniref:DUF397 domain-containing protein n=1 Tax=Amycolatopsis anabasis TaxID=1840409 RepID=UPI00131C10B1|nr:DUF397 domain-containing protein [Amycolatopsis anabasis]